MLGLGSIISGVGAIAGLLNNRKKQSAQDKSLAEMSKASTDAAARERQIAGMLMDLYKRRQGIADNAINSGTYDPERMIGRLDQDFARNSKRNLDNMAGSFSVMGYRPGDSEPGARLQAAFAQGQSRRDQMAENLRQNAPMQMLNLLSGAEGGYLGRVAGLEGAAANRLAGANANIYNANQPSDMSGFLSSLMPYLNRPGTPGINPGAEVAGGGGIGAMNFAPASLSFLNRLHRLRY